jgi:hypothetical protein
VATDSVATAFVAVALWGVGAALVFAVDVTLSSPNATTRLVLKLLSTAIASRAPVLGSMTSYTTSHDNPDGSMPDSGLLKP